MKTDSEKSSTFTNLTKSVSTLSKKSQASVSEIAADWSLEVGGLDYLL